MEGSLLDSIVTTDGCRLIAGAGTADLLRVLTSMGLGVRLF